MRLKNLTEIYTCPLYMFFTIVINYLHHNLKFLLLLYCVQDLNHFCQLDSTEVDQKIKDH